MARSPQVATLQFDEKYCTASVDLLCAFEDVLCTCVDVLCTFVQNRTTFVEARQRL